MELRYVSPATVADAAEAMATGRAKVLAGGTDLLVALRDRQLSCDTLVDIKRIPELQTIQLGDEISIGAAVPLREVTEHKEAAFALLKQAAMKLATEPLRNRATLVGNLCNASPGGDMLGVALVMEGEIEAVSAKGTRRIPLREFFLGVKKNALRPDEMATRVIFPKPKGKGVFYKSQRVRGHDLAQVGLAVYVKADGKVLAAVTAAAPTPVLIDDLGAFQNLTEEGAKKHVLSKIKPIDDQRATAEHRLHMVGYFMTQALSALKKEAGA